MHIKGSSCRLYATDLWKCGLKINKCLMSNMPKMTAFFFLYETLYKIDRTCNYIYMLNLSSVQTRTKRLRVDTSNRLIGH